MTETSYLAQIQAQTEARRRVDGWAQWFVARDGTRTPIYITQELNVLRGESVAALLETAVTIRYAVGKLTDPGLIWLYRDGRVELGDEPLGSWEA